MHVVLALLTTIVSVLYLLDRMGIDLGGLNPFYWRRRRAWAAKYQGDPIYSVEDPMHVAALLIVGVAKLDGDMSAEQKKVVLDQFESKFSLDSSAASELLGSAAHLLGAPQVIDAQLEGVAKKNKDRLANDQAESMIQMIVDVASADGKLSAKQSDYVASVRALFVEAEKGSGVWS
jgi:uncharacterized tellurite resistance protein B-like protein